MCEQTAMNFLVKFCEEPIEKYLSNDVGGVKNGHVQTPQN